MTAPALREERLREMGLDPDRIPRHVAIIMDGNGRWAHLRGEERVFGHLHGVESVRAAVETALETGVRYLTLYAFSTENWSRPQAEVEALMDLLVNTLVREVDDLAGKAFGCGPSATSGLCRSGAKRSCVTPKRGPHTSMVWIWCSP